MSIDIYFPDGDEIKTGHGSRVFLTNGEEVKDVTAIKINEFGGQDLITATITVLVGRVGALRDIPEGQR